MEPCSIPYRLLGIHINNDPDLSLRVQSLKLDPQYYAFAVKQTVL